VLSVILFRLSGSSMSLKAEPTSVWKKYKTSVWEKYKTDAALDLTQILKELTNPSTGKTKWRTDHLVALITTAYRHLKLLENSIPDSEFSKILEQLTQVLRVQSQSNPGVVEALVRDATRALTQMPHQHPLHHDMVLRLAQLKQEVLDQQTLLKQECNIDLVCGIVSCLESFRELIKMVFAYHTVPPPIRHQFILDMCRWIFVMLPFPITWRYFQTMIGCCILTTQQMAEIIENMSTSGAKCVLLPFSGRNLTGGLFAIYGIETEACDVNDFDGPFHPICVSDASTFLRKELSHPDSKKKMVFFGWPPAPYHNAGQECPDADALRVVEHMKSNVTHVVFIGDGGKSVGTPEAYDLLRDQGVFIKQTVSKAFVFGIPRLPSYPTPDDFVLTVKVRQD
jgi:hypothetical protein